MTLRTSRIRIVLGKPEVQQQLSKYNVSRAQLEAHGAIAMEAHANGSWVTVSETVELKRLAKDAMQQFLACHVACRAADTGALGKVALLVATTDMA